MDGTPERGRPLLSAWTSTDGKTAYLLVPLDCVDSPMGSDKSDNSEFDKSD